MKSNPLRGLLEVSSRRPKASRVAPQPTEPTKNIIIKFLRVSLLQNATNATLRSETLQKTVCDAIIANGGVKEP